MKIGDASGNNHSANASISASDNLVDVSGNELIVNETPQDSHDLSKRDDSTSIIELTVPIQMCWEYWSCNKQWKIKTV